MTQFVTEPLPRFDIEELAQILGQLQKTSLDRDQHALGAQTDPRPAAFHRGAVLGSLLRRKRARFSFRDEGLKAY